MSAENRRKPTGERSPHVRLALEAIEAYVRNGRTIEPGADLPDELLKEKAAAFVCLKKHGALRGCIGTVEPVYDCLAREIIANAISAATRDPRFLPVEESELGDLVCSVDVLGVPEECGLGDLDPKVYGVIVECGHRRGLLLPDLEGVDTVEEQVEIALRKAFIGPSEDVKLYRFRVNRYN